MATEVGRQLGTIATLDLAAALGFDEVELAAGMFRGGIATTTEIPDGEVVDQLRKETAQRGLRIGSVSSCFLPFESVWPEESRFVPPGAKGLPRTTAADYVAHLLWLTQISDVLGFRILTVFTWPFFSRTDDETLERFVTGIRPVLAAASDRGVVVCLEHDVLCSMSRTETGLRRVVDAVNHPGFGITIDTGNLYAAGIEPYPYAYREFKDVIRHVHLRGARRYRNSDPIDERYYPFTDHNPGDPRYCSFTSLEHGACNVDGLLGALVADGFTGAVSLQPLAKGERVKLLPQMLRDDLALVRARLARP